MVTLAVIQKGIVNVLEMFPEVLKDKLAVPPAREQMHRINLLPNHGSVNVRPYKYPHHQKE
ncbi:hypothetical protein L195_g050404 [Trifolium pratense]|uniref:Uncharacterized protein n=1 Tax=Trifolium pratense TaxID=57577 RepID=A0A2K3JTT3_TRIPR|nr:hypothetical protein L195_g050404 [Trifolium pratense]